VTSSILEVFGFSHLKTSPSWGEVPFLCPKILTAQGLRLLQNAQLNSSMPFRHFPQFLLSEHAPCPAFCRTSPFFCRPLPIGLPVIRQLHYARSRPVAPFASLRHKLIGQDRFSERSERMCPITGSSSICRIESFICWTGTSSPGRFPSASAEWSP